MAQILVVDGSVIDRKRIAGVLQATGHRVVEAGTAREACRLLDENGSDFELVVTEMKLPDQGGIAFIRAVKERCGSHVPVLVVAPLQPHEVVIEMVLAGAENMVSKPFATEILLRQVTEILEKATPQAHGDAQPVSWSLDQFLRREIKRTDRTGRSLSVLVMRVPPGSDRSLVPDIVRRVHIRETDQLFETEWGAILVLPDTDALGARVVEGRIRRVLVEGGGPAAKGAAALAGMTLGVATLPDDARTGEALLAIATQRAEADQEPVSG